MMFEMSGDILRIYVTHCSAKKDNSLKNTGKKVTPDKLYTATPLQRFMNKCKKRKVHWAIFSDKYCIWFPYEEHEWYEKNPNTVSEQEFRELVQNFEKKLGNYDEIYFYHNPGRFHPLYKRLLKEVKVRGKIILFSHLGDIT
jgi:hypothetical protein